MKSPMLPEDHQAAVQRALALGRSGNPSTLPELIELARLPSNEVQRLAASAIGKLAEFGADADMAVKTLAPMALPGFLPAGTGYLYRILGPQYAAIQNEYV